MFSKAPSRGKTRFPWLGTLSFEHSREGDGTGYTAIRQLFGRTPFERQYVAFLTACFEPFPIRGKGKTWGKRDAYSRETALPLEANFPQRVHLEASWSLPC